MGQPGFLFSGEHKTLNFVDNIENEMYIISLEMYIISLRINYN